MGGWMVFLLDNFGAGVSYTLPLDLGLLGVNAKVMGNRRHSKMDWWDRGCIATAFILGKVFAGTGTDLLHYEWKEIGHTPSSGLRIHKIFTGSSICANYTDKIEEYIQLKPFSSQTAS
jgi:hypothetical protein